MTSNNLKTEEYGECPSCKETTRAIRGKKVRCSCGVMLYFPFLDALQNMGDLANSLVHVEMESMYT